MSMTEDLDSWVVPDSEEEFEGEVRVRKALWVATAWGDGVEGWSAEVEGCDGLVLRGLTCPIVEDELSQGRETGKDGDESEGHPGPGLLLPFLVPVEGELETPDQGEDPSSVLTMSLS